MFKILLKKLNEALNYVYPWFYQRAIVLRIAFMFIVLYYYKNFSYYTYKVIPTSLWHNLATNSTLLFAVLVIVSGCILVLLYKLYRCYTSYSHIISICFCVILIFCTFMYIVHRSSLKLSIIFEGTMFFAILIIFVFALWDIYREKSFSINYSKGLLKFLYNIISSIVKIFLVMLPFIWCYVGYEVLPINRWPWLLIFIVSLSATSIIPLSMLVNNFFGFLWSMEYNYFSKFENIWNFLNIWYIENTILFYKRLFSIITILFLCDCYFYYDRQWWMDLTIEIFSLLVFLLVFGTIIGFGLLCYLMAGKPSEPFKGFYFLVLIITLGLVDMGFKTRGIHYGEILCAHVILSFCTYWLVIGTYKCNNKNRPDYFSAMLINTICCLMLILVSFLTPGFMTLPSPCLFSIIFVIIPTLLIYPFYVYWSDNYHIEVKYSIFTFYVMFIVMEFLNFMYRNYSQQICGIVINYLYIFFFTSFILWITIGTCIDLYGPFPWLNKLCVNIKNTIRTVLFSPVLFYRFIVKNITRIGAWKFSFKYNYFFQKFIFNLYKTKEHNIKMPRFVFLGALFVTIYAIPIIYCFGTFFNKTSFIFQYYAKLWFNQTGQIGLFFGVDGISLCFLFLTFFIFPLCIAGSFSFQKYTLGFLIYILLLYFLLIVSFSSSDLLFFFVCFESLLIPMFLFIGEFGSRERKIKAAYYFFLYTFFGSLFMLFGIFYMHSVVKITTFSAIFDNPYTIEQQLVLFCSFFVAFAVKIPVFPVHIWLPEAHVEAPTIGSVILASLLLKLGGYGFLRFILPILPIASQYYNPLICMLCVLSILYASFATLRQSDMKRIIAYSSIAHMNVIVLGLFSFTQQGIEGSIYLMIAHGVVSSALFFCVGILYDKYHTRLLIYYGGLVQVMPLFSLFLLLFTLANMSFPGTSNFIGELLILTGIFQINIWTMIFASTGIILSAIYSIWLFNRIIFGTLKTVYTSQFTDVTLLEFSIMVPLIILMIIFGLNSNIILDIIRIPTAQIVSIYTETLF